MDHPALRNCLEKYFVPNVFLPSINSVRNQISVIYAELFQKIKQQLSNKKVAILADESTDDQQRYFLQILFVELNAYNACRPYLAETCFLNETNHSKLYRNQS